MVKAVFTSHISHTPFTIIHVIFSYFIILSSQKKSCKIWILLLMTTPGCTKQLFRVVSVSLFYHLAVSHFSCYNTVLYCLQVQNSTLVFCSYDRIPYPLFLIPLTITVSNDNISLQKACHSYQILVEII